MATLLVVANPRPIVLIIALVFVAAMIVAGSDKVVSCQVMQRLQVKEHQTDGSEQGLLKLMDNYMAMLHDDVGYHSKRSANSGKPILRFGKRGSPTIGQSNDLEPIDIMPYGDYQDYYNSNSALDGSELIKRTTSRGSTKPILRFG